MMNPEYFLCMFENLVGYDEIDCFARKGKGLIFNIQRKKFNAFL